MPRAPLVKARAGQAKACTPTQALKFMALTAERWADLEKLFGPRGACGGCWCMWWRLTRSQFVAQKGEKNRSAFKKIVRENEKPGILAYLGGEPIGWCAIAPRQVYTFLERSRVLARIDDQSVWSITCLFVARAFRRSGVSVQLIKAAVAHARSDGAKIVEGYPVEPRKTAMPDAFAWTGLASAFRQAGFKEVARRSGTRPIMRSAINAADKHC